MTTYQHAAIRGHKIFNREAGSTKNLTVVLLHGFPSSSHMFDGGRFLLKEHGDFVAGKIIGFLVRGQEAEAAK